MRTQDPPYIENALERKTTLYKELGRIVITLHGWKLHAVSSLPTTSFYSYDIARVKIECQRPTDIEVVDQNKKAILRHEPPQSLTRLFQTKPELQRPTCYFIWVFQSPLEADHHTGPFGQEPG